MEEEEEEEMSEFMQAVRACMVEKEMVALS
jgi:hypothetical protein